MPHWPSDNGRLCITGKAPDPKPPRLLGTPERLNEVQQRHGHPEHRVTPRARLPHESRRGSGSMRCATVAGILLHLSQTRGLERAGAALPLKTTNQAPTAPPRARCVDASCFCAPYHQHTSKLFTLVVFRLSLSAVSTGGGDDVAGARSARNGVVTQRLCRHYPRAPASTAAQPKGCATRVAALSPDHGQASERFANERRAVTHCDPGSALPPQHEAMRRRDVVA